MALAQASEETEVNCAVALTRGFRKPERDIRGLARKTRESRGIPKLQASLTPIELSTAAMAIGELESFYVVGSD